MALLLVIVIPLAALVIYAVVSDLRRRRRGAVRSHDISSAARAARADADARGASGLRPPDGGTPGAAGLSHGP
jgi:Tfp pilus assembly protein FimT